ncbi:MAG: hypothetical protein RJB38_1057, partial [Pseudomonadota bacterium]
MKDLTELLVQSSSSFGGTGEADRICWAAGCWDQVA